MTIAIGVLSGVAALVALVCSGVYLFLAWTVGQEMDGRAIAWMIVIVVALDLGSAGLAAWRSWHGTGGLWPALISLGLSGLMAFAAGGLAHGIANP